MENLEELLSGQAPDQTPDVHSAPIVPSQPQWCTSCHALAKQMEEKYAKNFMAMKQKIFFTDNLIHMYQGLKSQLQRAENNVKLLTNDKELMQSQLQLMLSNEEPTVAVNKRLQEEVTSLTKANETLKTQLHAMDESRRMHEETIKILKVQDSSLLQELKRKHRQQVAELKEEISEKTEGRNKLLKRNKALLDKLRAMKEKRRRRSSRSVSASSQDEPESGSRHPGSRSRGMSRLIHTEKEYADITAPEQIDKLDSEVMPDVAENISHVQKISPGKPDKKSKTETLHKPDLTKAGNKESSKEKVAYITSTTDDSAGESSAANKKMKENTSPGESKSQLSNSRKEAFKNQMLDIKRKRAMAVFKARPSQAGKEEYVFFMKKMKKKLSTNAAIITEQNIFDHVKPDLEEYCARHHLDKQEYLVLRRFLKFHEGIFTELEYRWLRNASTGVIGSNDVSSLQTLLSSEQSASESDAPQARDSQQQPQKDMIPIDAQVQHDKVDSVAGYIPMPEVNDALRDSHTDENVANGSRTEINKTEFHHADQLNSPSAVEESRLASDDGTKLQDSTALDLELSEELNRANTFQSDLNTPEFTPEVSSNPMAENMFMANISVDSLGNGSAEDTSENHAISNADVTMHIISDVNHTECENDQVQSKAAKETTEIPRNTEPIDIETDSVNTMQEVEDGALNLEPVNRTAEPSDNAVVPDTTVERMQSVQSASCSEDETTKIALNNSDIAEDHVEEQVTPGTSLNTEQHDFVEQDSCVDKQNAHLDLGDTNASTKSIAESSNSYNSLDVIEKEQIHDSNNEGLSTTSPTLGRSVQVNDKQNCQNPEIAKNSINREIEQSHPSTVLPGKSQPVKRKLEHHEEQDCHFQEPTPKVARRRTRSMALEDEENSPLRRSRRISEKEEALSSSSDNQESKFTQRKSSDNMTINKNKNRSSSLKTKPLSVQTKKLNRKVSENPSKPNAVVNDKGKTPKPMHNPPPQISVTSPDKKSEIDFENATAFLSELMDSPFTSDEEDTSLLEIEPTNKMLCTTPHDFIRVFQEMAIPLALSPLPDIDTRARDSPSVSHSGEDLVDTSAFAIEDCKGRESISPSLDLCTAINFAPSQKDLTRSVVKKPLFKPKNPVKEKSKGSKIDKLTTSKAPSEASLSNVPLPSNLFPSSSLSTDILKPRRFSCEAPEMAVSVPPIKPMVKGASFDHMPSVSSRDLRKTSSLPPHRKEGDVPSHWHSSMKHPGKNNSGSGVHEELFGSNTAKLVLDQSTAPPILNLVAVENLESSCDDVDMHAVENTSFNMTGHISSTAEDVQTASDIDENDILQKMTSFPSIGTPVTGFESGSDSQTILPIEKRATIPSKIHDVIAKSTDVAGVSKDVDKVSEIVAQPVAPSDDSQITKGIVRSKRKAAMKAGGKIKVTYTKDGAADVVSSSDEEASSGSEYGVTKPQSPKAKDDGVFTVPDFQHGLGQHHVGEKSSMTSSFAKPVGACTSRLSNMNSKETIVLNSMGDVEAALLEILKKEEITLETGEMFIWDCIVNVIKEKDSEEEFNILELLKKDVPVKSLPAEEQVFLRTMISIQRTGRHKGNFLSDFVLPRILQFLSWFGRTFTLGAGKPGHVQIDEEIRQVRPLVGPYLNFGRAKSQFLSVASTMAVVRLYAFLCRALRSHRTLFTFCNNCLMWRNTGMLLSAVEAVACWPKAAKEHSLLSQAVLRVAGKVASSSHAMKKPIAKDVVEKVNALMQHFGWYHTNPKMPTFLAQTLEECMSKLKAAKLTDIFQSLLDGRYAGGDVLSVQVFDDDTTDCILCLKILLQDCLIRELEEVIHSKMWPLLNLWAQHMHIHGDVDEGREVTNETAAALLEVLSGIISPRAVVQRYQHKEQQLVPHFQSSIKVLCDMMDHFSKIYLLKVPRLVQCATAAFLLRICYCNPKMIGAPLHGWLSATKKFKDNKHRNLDIICSLACMSEKSIRDVALYIDVTTDTKFLDSMVSLLWRS